MSAPDLNWVERRFAREQALRNKSMEIWNALLTSIERAVGAYETHYSNQRTGVEFESSPMECSVRILRQAPILDVSVATVSFNRSTSVIRARTTDGLEVVFKIEADDSGSVFLTREGAPVTVDQASEMILGPLLFPDPPSAHSALCG